MKRKIILLFVFALFSIFWTNDKFERTLERDIYNGMQQNLDKLKKIAIIEFAILPPEFVETEINENQLVCIPYHEIKSSLNMSVLQAIIISSKSSTLSQYQEKIYPAMTKINKQMTDGLCRYAGEYWDRKTAAQVIHAKELFNSSAYKSLPAKGITTYPVDLTKNASPFPELSIPSGSYNFFEVSKDYNVLKYGEYSLSDEDISGYSSDQSESALDKGIKVSRNLAEICSTLNVDAVALITVSVVTRANPDLYQHLLIRLFMYDSKGDMILPVMYLSRKMLGEPSDIVHYERVLKEFDNVITGMIDILYFREW